MAIPCQVLQIGRALDGEPRPVEHVSIDHGGCNIGVSQEFLDGSDVVMSLKKMSGKRVKILQGFKMQSA